MVTLKYLRVGCQKALLICVVRKSNPEGKQHMQQDGNVNLVISYIKNIAVSNSKTLELLKCPWTHKQEKFQPFLATL